MTTDTARVYRKKLRKMTRQRTLYPKKYRWTYTRHQRERGYTGTDRKPLAKAICADARSRC
jgi:ribosomal protein L19E